MIGACKERLHLTQERARLYDTDPTESLELGGPIQDSAISRNEMPSIFLCLEDVFSVLTDVIWFSISGKYAVYLRSDALFVLRQTNGLRKDALSRPLLDLDGSIGM